MQNVRVMSGPTPLSARICVGTHEFVADDELGFAGPRPLDLLLAGLGGCTVAALQRYAATSGWALDGVYVELAMHGTFPFQAIGRRVWIDGSLDDGQLLSLARVADRTLVAQALASPVELSTAVMPFPRPDRPSRSRLIG